MPLQSTKLMFRGGTVYWETTFYDITGAVAQPIAAFVNVNYPDTNGNRNTTQVQMSGPNLGPQPPIGTWTAYLDTRDMGIGPVNWSIHTQGPIPVSVEDGSFTLSANPANLVTFP